MYVDIQKISKVYENVGGRKQEVLSKVSLNIQQGEFVCLLGPSGSGKSTLLRIIAGIEQADSGQVVCDGQLVTSPSPQRGFVFQDYGLFHWLTVRRNIQFGLEQQGLTREKRNEIVDHYLQLMELSKAADMYPDQLSGGMKQRVAIARALCLKPSLLLMDEPFGALDPMTRFKMQEELIRVWQLEKVTIVFVTHDVEEALYLADRIAIMSKRTGDFSEILNVPMARPRNRTNQEFVKFREYIYEVMGLNSLQSMTVV